MATREGSAWMAAAVVAVLVSSCAGGQQAPAAAASSPTVITWLADPITQDQVNDPRLVLIDAFEKAYPAIRVDVISGPTSTDALRDTLRSRLADPGSGGVPDVYLGDLIWPAVFAQDHLALPLSDHLPRGFWNRFVPNLVKDATYRGTIYAAPFFREQGLLYYNRGMLQRAGMPVPTTWEQLAQEASALQKLGVARYGFVWTGAKYEGLTCVWTEVMTDALGSVTNTPDTGRAIDSLQSLQALTFLRSLVTSGVTPPDVANFQEPDVTAAFIGGQTVFARNWTSLYDTARTQGLQDVVGVAPLPRFSGQPQVGFSTAGGWNLYINPRTRHLAAALAFIQWMTGVDAQEIMAREYNELPVNASVLGDASLQAASPVLAAGARNWVVLRPASTPAYPAVSQAIYTNVGDAILGRRSPGDALSAASKTIDALLHESP